jgi:hypothetical protein
MFAHLNPVKVRAKGAAMPRVEQGLSATYWGLLRWPCKFNKFHDVDTPFSAFVFGDERLRPTKAFGESMLG